ncbi:MAG TPA: hypothetical protein QF901_14245 [Gammaproteobacteria bacterium]|nr:hypothetical protein [Gammaproteobacteria bacterium]
MRIVGIVEASEEEKRRARRVAFAASRSNVTVSIPTLRFIQAGGDGVPMG